MQGRKPAAPPGTQDDRPLPRASVEVPAPPSYLRGRARDVWPDVVFEMVRRQIYDTDIEPQVAAYCSQFARYLDAEDHITEHGTLIRLVREVESETGTSESGKPKRTSRPKKVITEWVANPNIMVSDRACDRMLRLAAELGLTPVARRRVQKVKRDGPAVAATNYLRAVGD